MKNRIITLSVAIVFVAIFCTCKKDETTAKMGQVTFSGPYGSKSTNTYTVTVEGKTTEFEGSNPTPACGTISSETAFFTLPAGTHTYTATIKKVNFFDYSVQTYPAGPISFTITEGTCVSIRF